MPHQMSTGWWLRKPIDVVHGVGTASDDAVVLEGRLGSVEA